MFQKARYQNCHFSSSNIEAKSTWEDDGNILIHTKTILTEPKVKMQFIPLMCTVKIVFSPKIWLNGIKPMCVLVMHLMFHSVLPRVQFI